MEEEYMTIEEQIDRLDMTFSIVEALLHYDENAKKKFLQNIIDDDKTKAAFISDCYDLMVMADDNIENADSSVITGAVLFKRNVKEIIDLALSIPTIQTHSDYVNALSKKSSFR